MRAPVLVGTFRRPGLLGAAAAFQQARWESSSNISTAAGRPALIGKAAQEERQQMKLAFSTLSCPEWSLDTILEYCEKCAYDGLELRGLGEHLNLLEAPDLAPQERSAVRERFEGIGTRICCVSSSATFACADSSERMGQLRNCEAHVELAAELNAPLVRVFGGNIPEGAELPDAVAWVAEALAAAAARAAPYGVTVAIETHDAFVTGRICADVLAAAACPNIGCLWDIHHPFRHGEAVEDTVRHLGRSIVHVHAKDGVLQPSGKIVYRLVGEGTLPIREILLRLSMLDYDGHISLEWEKRWHPELEAPEVAVPQFASTMRKLIRDLS